MNKLLLTIIMVVIMITACETTNSQGAENACQFVREQMPELTNFAQMEAEPATVTIYRIEDMDSCTSILEKAEKDAEIGVIRYGELCKKAEEIESTLKMHTLPAYTVTITQKSTKQDVVRVIMNDNGTTPYILYSGYERRYNEFIERLANDQAVIDIPTEE